MQRRSSSAEGSQQNPPLLSNKGAAPVTGLEDSMWKLGLGSRDSYSERPGETNCVYYMRTGSCAYGVRCRFNHPNDRSSTVLVTTIQGEHPEREGQPVCQFYTNTGTCKFGASCKFHHPKDGRGAMNPVELNYHGYPLRPGEKECSYYVKTGQCKFGGTCKFHHPQPSSTSMAAPASKFPQNLQAPFVPYTQQYGGGPASWQVPRPPLLPGSYAQGTYGPVMISPGMVPISGWSPYPAPVNQVASPSTQGTVRAGPLYGVTRLFPPGAAYAGPRPPLPFSIGRSSSNEKENVHPERPGQPECRYYMRTGDCKYRSICRYHHPPGRTPNTLFSPSHMGLSLREGAAP